MISRFSHEMIFRKPQPSLLSRYITLPATSGGRERSSPWPGPCRLTAAVDTSMISDDDQRPPAPAFVVLPRGCGGASFRTSRQAAWHLATTADRADPGAGALARHPPLRALAAR